MVCDEVRHRAGAVERSLNILKVQRRTPCRDLLSPVFQKEPSARRAENGLCRVPQSGGYCNGPGRGDGPGPEGWRAVRGPHLRSILEIKMTTAVTRTLITVVIYWWREILRLHSREGLRDLSFRAGSSQSGEIPRVCPISLLTGKGGTEAREGRCPRWAVWGADAKLASRKTEPRGQAPDHHQQVCSCNSPSSQLGIPCIAAASSPSASAWTLPVTGSSTLNLVRIPVPFPLSLGGQVSHLGTQTWPWSCPHRAARTLFPVFHRTLPSRSGLSFPG